MKPINNNTPKSKIRILKLIKKVLEKDVDSYFPDQTRYSPGFCSVIQDLWHDDIIEDNYYPKSLGLVKPKEYPWPFWYEKWKRAPRIANINRAIKRLEKQI